MESAPIVVYQCKNCRYVVSDSSFKEWENESFLCVKDAMATLGPEDKHQNSSYIKMYEAVCQCKSQVGIYIKTPPPDKPQLGGKCILDKQRLLRYVLGRGFPALQNSVNEKIKNLRDKMLDLNYTAMLSLHEIVRLKEMVCIVANDPEVMKLLQTNWSSKSSDVDSI